MSPINFSRIPGSKLPRSPWASLRLSLGITFGIGAIIALGIPLSWITGITLQSAEAMLGGVLLLVFIGFAIRAFWFALNSSRVQIKRMALFAADNGWSFNGNVEIANGSTLPPTSLFQPNGVYMRYRIAGKTDKGAFDLYLLKGLVQQSLPVTAINPWSSSFGFLTVIRTSYSLLPQELNDFQATNQGGYGYAVHTGNALARETLQQLFAFASQPAP